MPGDERLLQAVSAELDGGPPVREPLDVEAAAFRRDALRLREAVRFGVAEAPPDVVQAVLARIGTDGAPGRRTPVRRSIGPLAAVAAALVAVVGLAGLLVSTRSDAPPEVADLGAELLVAQRTVERYAADVTVTEYGWHPGVPERRYRGFLRYAAPETFHLRLADETTYPTSTWSANDVEVVVDDGTAWSSASPACPVAAVPACLSPRPAVDEIAERAPFSARQAAPLDVVLPVGGFAPGAAETGRHVDGAIEVATTVGRARSVVDGLTGHGNWRAFHPTDVVVMRLDPDVLTIRQLRIEAAAGDDRVRWAAANGYADGRGAVLLDATFEPVPFPGGSPPSPPSGATVHSDQFVDLPVDQLALTLPPRVEGLELHRSGTFGRTDLADVELAAWTDGRAWAIARWTTTWTGDRLFGTPGDVVRRVDLGSAGVGYRNGSGDRLALHGAGVDVEVTGTAGSDVLADLARALGVVGRPVPAAWAEAPSEIPVPGGTLVPPGEWSSRVDDRVVTISVAAPGEGGYLLTQMPAAVLPPPATPDVLATVVRGVTGRHSEALGELEWVEDGLYVSLRSQGRGRDGLVAVADALERADGRPPTPPVDEAVGRETLLAWTSGGLPAGAAERVGRAVDASTTVLGDVVDLVGSRAGDGVPVDVVPAGWAIPFDVLAVHPSSYAPFLPPRVRPEVAGLGPGQALLTETAARLRGVGPGATLRFSGGGEVEVVGVIDDVSGAGAEALVTVATGQAIGAMTDRFVLVSVDESRVLTEKAVAAAIGAGPVRFRASGETPYLRHGDAVLPLAQVKARFGEFAYQRGPGREITIDPAWVAANIVRIEPPIVGPMLCHRGVAQSIETALRDLTVRGKTGLVEADPAGGCWVPRLIDDDMPLSRHAWGIAIDLNPTANPSGFFGDQDERVVEVMRRQGFGWGGEWLVPDPSHFEFAGP